jgi:hypothetical protein
MHNPQFYEKQRMRASTWDIPRFLRFFDETIDGGLIVPRGMLTTVTELAAQAGSKLDLADERAAGTTQAFTCSAVLTGPQQAAVQVLARHDLGVLVAPPGTGNTVMACAVIAAHQVSTLVLVDKKPQLSDGLARPLRIAVPLTCAFLFWRPACHYPRGHLHPAGIVALPLAIIACSLNTRT